MLIESPDKLSVNGKTLKWYEGVTFLIFNTPSGKKTHIAISSGRGPDFHMQINDFNLTDYVKQKFPEWSIAMDHESLSSVIYDLKPDLINKNINRSDFILSGRLWTVDGKNYISMWNNKSRLETNKFQLDKLMLLLKVTYQNTLFELPENQNDYKPYDQIGIDKKPESEKQKKDMSNFMSKIHMLSPGAKKWAMRGMSPLHEDLDSTDSIKKQELKSLIRECVVEIMNDKSVGIHEVMQFYSNAPMDKIIEVERLIASGDNYTAWLIIEKFLNSADLLVRKSIDENRVNELNWKKTLATAALAGATLFGSPNVDAANKPTVKKSNEKPLAISHSSFVGYLKNVENSIKAGYKNGKWYPHKSFEGGTDTIAYGHKLKKGENFSSGLTDVEADALLKKDIELARQTVRREIKKYGGSTLSPEKEEMLIDFSFNIGTIHKFPKFVGAILKDDWKTAKKEYKRYSLGKELKNRNEEFYKRFLSNK